MAKRSKIREEFYQFILDDASGYVGYWYNDEHEAGNVKRYSELTTDDVARGWQRLIEFERAGKFFCCGSDRAVRDSEASLSSKDGGEDYDACVADAVIQLAVLGDIVYG